VFSLLEGRFERIEKSIVLRLFDELLLLRVGDPLFKLLPQIVSLLLKKISLLHVDHQFLDIHSKREPIVSVESIEKILAKIPSVPSNNGAAFVSPLCAEV
jgi:hypothetical protein